MSKAIFGLLTSPKKQTDKFDLFAFLLFVANKSSVRFLGESTAGQSNFGFIWPFVPAKRKVEISQNFVAFSEYMNFITMQCFQEMFLTHSDKVKVVIPLNLKSSSFIVMFWVAQNNYPNYRSEHDLVFQGIVS